MQADNRKNDILNLLNKKSSVTVSELSEMLKISEVSVRKLLTSMEQEGQLKRTWGGAVSTYGSLRELSNDEKVTRHLAEKQSIAQAAYNCIDDGEAVFLDSGTTSIQLAKLIVTGHKRKIMVATNAINIGMELCKAEDIQSIIIGGEIRHKIYSCVGYLTDLCLNHLNFDKGFITGNHFSLEHGFTTPNLQEAETKRRILSVSKERFVLMDYSKYGDDSLALIAPMKDVDTIITDWHIPPEIVKQINDKGVRVIVGDNSD